MDARDLQCLFPPPTLQVATLSRCHKHFRASIIFTTDKLLGTPNVHFILHAPSYLVLQPLVPAYAGVDLHPVDFTYPSARDATPMAVAAAFGSRGPKRPWMATALSFFVRLEAT